MPTPTAQYTIAKPAGSGGGGILPMAAVTNAPAKDSKTQPKSLPQRLKVIVRRLPPGLTQTEFETAMGDEWKLANSKVSWFQYRPGKVSKDLSKPSKPARAYFQLSHRDHLEPLAEKVRNTPFLDACSTANDAALLAPPSLEFAPYARVPLSRKRNDTRQGLVDQDPEFIAFLESLTDPTPKPPPIDSADAPRMTEEPIKVTPLIQHLRDKKAAKEAAKEKDKAVKKESKHARQASKPENSNTAASNKSAPSITKSSTDNTEKRPLARPIKDEKPAGKQSKKEKEQQQKQPQSQQSEQSPKAKPTSSIETSRTTTNESSTRRTTKASSATSAASIIQRDLGIKGKTPARARPARQAADSETSATVTPLPTPLVDNKGSKPTETTSIVSPTSPTPELAPPSSPNPPSKPAPGSSSSKRDKQERQTSNQKANSKKLSSTHPSQSPTATSATPAAKPKSQSQKSLPTITPTATHAFLKHANPSQGITESLLATTLSAFGQVTNVEIDKRKGFAYVDFAEHEGLKTAIGASPVKIAQGSVQILERKDRPVASSSSRTANAASNSARGGSASASASNDTTSAPPPASKAAGSRGARGRGGRGSSARANAGASALPVQAKSPTRPATVPQADSAAPGSELATTDPVTTLSNPSNPQPASTESTTAAIPAPEVTSPPTLPPTPHTNHIPTEETQE